MSDEFLNKIRAIQSLEGAIITGVTLIKAQNLVKIDITTDKAYSTESLIKARHVARSFVPDAFDYEVNITKLTPDTDMVARKIFSILQETNKVVAALVTQEDIQVERCLNGFYFTIAIVRAGNVSSEYINTICANLKKTFCGEFSGKFVTGENKIDSLVIEEEHENIEYNIPIRTFKIEGFETLEGTKERENAVYMADMNFESQDVTVCGRIEDIAERTYTRQSNGQEKTYYNFTITDTTATMRATYFTRQKSIEKIKKLQVGDSIVCSGKSEIFNGSVRFTANTIDYGKIPEGFVPEKRASKPAPRYYSVVKPQPYEDFNQADFFTEDIIPDCLKQNTFVVFDLETTGLNSSPSSGNMDRIIEIGAYKIEGGIIKESFTTFINPERKLSDEIINLTGIRQEMVQNAPTYQQVMPDFFKFCQGAYLVGHNIAGFDFKFVDYYCAQLGYNLERKLFDTIPLAQELLFLSNYKLNTVADHFGITFNHHRAIDDALVTAKIFIQLIKIKKSLPKLS
jgi:DNA polymerase III epsilon subunit family exonuclease